MISTIKLTGHTILLVCLFLLKIHLGDATGEVLYAINAGE